MAQKKRSGAAVPYKNKFAESVLTIGRRFSISKVFEDFLFMTIASCTRNPSTGLSYYEDEYLQTIAHYKDAEERFEFPKAFAYLVNEMDERLHSNQGNDVLGEFYEMNISHGHNGQFFTPYHICELMARLTQGTNNTSRQTTPLRILDPSCGSGRMLLASQKIYGAGQEYFGIDISSTCVKMTAINLFLNGMWNSEVMCADALLPEDFIISYRISNIPLGIFKVEHKEQSMLWQMYRNSSYKNEANGKEGLTNLRPFIEIPKNDSSQLNLF